MPPDASKTRAGLLDAAARAFAHDGVFNASLIDITRQAGQRNRAALRYHFGSRDGVLCAVIERHAEFLAHREGELLEVAKHEVGLEPVIEALVRPAAELADSGWRGRCCLLIIAELTGEDRAQYSAQLQAVLASTGGDAVFALLTERTVSDPFWRLLLVTGFLGGYTTFSSYTYESMQLIQDGRWGAGLLYVGGSNLAGLLCCAAGMAIARAVFIS